MEQAELVYTAEGEEIPQGTCLADVYHSSIVYYQSSKPGVLRRLPRTLNSLTLNVKLHLHVQVYVSLGEGPELLSKDSQRGLLFIPSEEM